MEVVACPAAERILESSGTAEDSVSLAKIERLGKR